jgi:hypothetical protein
VGSELGLGLSLQTESTVFLPENPAEALRKVCFGYPGGGYSRRYFATDIYEPGSRGQAEWHTDRGWVFVSTDYLNAGDSSHIDDPGVLTYEHLVEAGHATVKQVLQGLAQGTILPGYQRIQDPFTIGLGQSLGGGIIVLQQGQKATFDAVAILGFSGRHTRLWMPPGNEVATPTYIPRGTNIATLSAEVHHAAIPEMTAGSDGLPLAAPGFHFDDVPNEVVVADLVEYPTRRGDLPVWASATMPPCSMTMMSPGALSPEAAVITCPVFIGLGERDTVPDPRGEPAAYPRSPDISLFICAGMAHMHNFATSRKRLWSRIHGWGDTVAA